MKILLLNDNPVVNKLVTLSAQKTSDELEVVENPDNINEGTYDLLVVDDALYEDTLFQNLEEKINFTKSLHICSKDTENASEFSRTIKKPFLPTDLVELFSVIGKEVAGDIIEEEPTDESVLSSEDDISLDKIALDDEEELVDIDSEITTDELEALEDNLEEDLSSSVVDLDSEITTDELEALEDN